MSVPTTAARKVTIIPADPQYTKKDIRKQHLRVAPYCRVSTDSEEQLTSYESQIAYYTAKIAENPDWTMVRLYADEGITGTSMKKRKHFLEMIADCEAGKIDLVITKSTTRFARNTLEGIQIVRKLKRLGIGVFFEKENTNTLYMDNEMILTFFFSQAQAESESLSKNVSWGHRRNFENGKVYYHYKSFLGYRKGADGQPEIDEEQAAVVRRIFARYLMGDSIRKIRKDLEADGMRTARGNATWSDSAVQLILRNEKYIGDALLQKTFVEDIFTRRSVKNVGQLPKYYVHDCHPPIIDRATFQKVQEEMARRSGKRKTSSKAKTELGKYSGKYALIEIMICGECGSPYRRTTYMPNGERTYVWRCLNRIENGKRICKHSPTFAEADIHHAVVAAMNELISQQAAKEVLKDSITTALAAAEPELTLPAVESQIQALQARQVELYKLASSPDAGEEYDEEIGRIHESKMRMLRIKAELAMAQQTSTEFDRRMEAISAAIAEDSGEIDEYDDIRTRQLISNIKVLDKERLLVRFKDGTEIVQHIEKKECPRHNSHPGEA